MSEAEAVSRTVYGMFERAARLARKLGYAHDRVIHLALWSDGELAYKAWEWFDWLLVNDPELTASALRGLPLAEQKRICGSGITASSTRDIVNTCHTDM